MVEEPSYTCAKCGGPNPAYARNCQWCGAALKPVPLPSSSPSPPPRFEGPTEDFDADRDGSGTPWGQSSIWVRAVIALILVVVFIAAVVALSPPSPLSPSQTPLPSGPAVAVDVTVIDLTSSDNACGLNGTTEPGFQGVTNAASGENWHITGTPEGCTISGISAVTGGFQVLSVDVPQSIAAGQTAAISVSFVMIGLGGPYTGPLVISVT